MERVPLGTVGGDAAALLTPGLGCGEGRNGPQLFEMVIPMVQPHFGQLPLHPCLVLLGGQLNSCLSVPPAAACLSTCHLLSGFLAVSGQCYSCWSASELFPHQGTSAEELLCSFLQVLGRSCPTAETAIQNTSLQPLCMIQQQQS